MIFTSVTVPSKLMVLHKILISYMIIIGSWMRELQLPPENIDHVAGFTVKASSSLSISIYDIIIAFFIVNYTHIKYIYPVGSNRVRLCESSTQGVKGRPHSLLETARYLEWRAWAIIFPVFFFLNSIEVTPTAFPTCNSFASISISSCIVCSHLYSDVSRIVRYTA